MRRKRWVMALTIIGLMGGVAPIMAQSGECASTPAEAVKAARAGAHQGSPEDRALPDARAAIAVGYRVESVRWDAMQRQSWAVIRSCDHAERPAWAMLADLPPGNLQSRRMVPVEVALEIASSPTGATPAGQTVRTASARIALANVAVMAVHAGDAVRLWKADEQAHIELTGVAEENGVAGGRVRVRLVVAKGLGGQGTEGQGGPSPVLMGVVRGPADVEIER